ncbi:Translin [Lojkania enalia]|uniref:Translin n=1 Tax=Lojkania enalia TaxID=147567 RepID=A0A9P4N149_9PLEO|nr:Translin [Didymosphaeria enalia]
MGQKRTRDGAMAEAKQEQPSSPYVPMFENFRIELDEHHDRRERIIKASRDITASSKKIIFTLQRIRNVGVSLPEFAVKNNAQYWKTIETQYKAVSADLRGINAYRYRQITWGNQEFMESLCFQHYLETQTLISYDEAKMHIASMSGEAGPVLLTPEDYILGIFDMIGELMRFSITSMATNGTLPTGKPNKNKRFKQAVSEDQDEKIDIDSPLSEDVESRSVLDDLRELRLCLEMLDVPRTSKFYDDVEKKMGVMRECVDKVEKALYSLTVRGKERPKGWNPDVKEGEKDTVESR